MFHFKMNGNWSTSRALWLQMPALLLKNPDVHLSSARWKQDSTSEHYNALFSLQVSHCISLDYSVRERPSRADNWYHLSNAIQITILAGCSSLWMYSSYHGNCWRQDDAIGRSYHLIQGYNNNRWRRRTLLNTSFLMILSTVQGNVYCNEITVVHNPWDTSIPPISTCSLLSCT